MKFVLFKKSLETDPAPIYLFDGEEEYFKERGEEMLKEKFLQEPSLNFSVFHGETMKGSQLTALLAAVQSIPFMSEKRIVKVTDFYPTEADYERYLKEYFELSFNSTTISRLEPATVSLTATQKKPLPSKLQNGVITLEVIGDVKEQSGTSNYSTTKEVVNLDISSITHSITFTPTNVGNYIVLAHVTCDGVSENGDLTGKYTFTINSDSSAYPEEPITSFLTA